MSEALKAVMPQRLVAHCSKSSKKSNNSNQLGLGISQAPTAVSGSPEALNRPASDDSMAKARQAKERLIEQGRALKQDWLDADHWRVLASQKRYRLPPWYIPLSAGGIERTLRDLGLDSEFFREVFGKKETYKRFVIKNPRLPLWAFAGMCLEAVSST